MKPRLYVAGVFGGLALLVVVAVLVFAFGRSDPSPPSLTKHPRPEIPGEILYVNADACFVRVQASGASSTLLACVPQLVGGSMFWPEPDTAAFVRPIPGAETLWTVDLATGAAVDTGRTVSVGVPPFSGPFGGAHAPDGTYAYVDDSGDLIFLANGVRTEVTKFETPRYGPPQVVLWSPDSQWLLLRYYPRRANGPELWVISRDASIQGTLLKDASYSGFAWRIGDEVEPKLPQ